MPAAKAQACEGAEASRGDWSWSRRPRDDAIVLPLMAMIVQWSVYQTCTQLAKEALVSL